MVLSTDILIVGGGPAGATCAGLLARAGFGVVVCESKGFPREKVCGEFMGMRLRPVLGRLGLLEEFDGRAAPTVVRVVGHAGGLSVAGELPSDDAGAFPRGFSRGELDEMLLGRARELGVRVVQPCHVGSVVGDGRAG